MTGRCPGRAAGLRGTIVDCNLSMATRSSERSRRFARRIGVALVALALFGIVVGSSLASPSTSSRATIAVLSAAMGSNDVAANKCPNNTATGLDNLPIVFNWFIRPTSVKASDFTIVNQNGTTTHPLCALQYPPDERNELQTINLIGSFGESQKGQRPVRVEFSGALQGRPIGAQQWRPLGALPAQKIVQVEAAPFIVDAWTLTPALYTGDRNRCSPGVGATFIRVVWSNGVTAYSDSGEISEVGDAITASYRAVYRLAGGGLKAFAPLAVADLLDHGGTAAMDDNMHDLCLPPVPRGAKLHAIKIGANLVQDPNGDPNKRQTFVVRP